MIEIRIAAIAALMTLALPIPAAAQQMPNIKAERTASLGESPAFTSSVAPTDLHYETGYLGGHIEAPLQSVQILHFLAAVDEVWEWVTSGNDEWSLSIETLEWNHSSSETPGKLGRGSVRKCDFRGGGGTAYERVHAVEPGKLFAYDIDPQRSSVPLPVKDFFVIWTLENKGADGTLVMARIYFNEIQDMKGEAAKGVAAALGADFRNFANVHNGTYVEM